MLGRMATDQLAAWERLADGWAVEAAGRRLECGACHGSILLLTDRHGAEYQYTPDEHRALVVLHLRNFHSHLNPDKG